jgi:hypothetical protein
MSNIGPDQGGKDLAKPPVYEIERQLLRAGARRLSAR